MSEDELPSRDSEAFVVDTFERLTWYIRKRSRLISEIATVKKQMDYILRCLKAQLESLEQRHGETAMQTTLGLIDQGKANKGNKTISTPFGDVGVVDRAAGLVGDKSFDFYNKEFREKNQELFSEVVEVNFDLRGYMAKCKRAYEITGEVPEGMVFGPSSRSVSFSKPAVWAEDAIGINGLMEGSLDESE